MDDIDFSNAIKNGFRICVLYPFSADNVDYSRITQKTAPKQVSLKTKSRLTHLQYLESKMDSKILVGFRGSKFTETNKSLYDV